VNLKKHNSIICTTADKLRLSFQKIQIKVKGMQQDSFQSKRDHPRMTLTSTPDLDTRPWPIYYEDVPACKN